MRAVAAVPTFRAMAQLYIETHQGTWRNAKHRYQWRQTLTDYCGPIRDKPVNEIATADVLAVLKPLWSRAPETASRLRGRIESVLDAAQALGHIPEDRANPARWKGHLAKLLPKPEKLPRGHQKALPYADAPGFAAAGLRQYGGARLGISCVVRRPRASAARGVFELAITVLPFVALWAAMLIASRNGQVWLSLSLAPLAAGLLVRLFMIQHDCGALKVSDIPGSSPGTSERMTLRVEQGKGQGKGQRDRYVMLSPRLLELLREWWRAARLEKARAWPPRAGLDPPPRSNPSSSNSQAAGYAARAFMI